MKKAWLWIILPLVTLAIAIAVFLSSNPLAPLGVSAPPIEKLTVERTLLGDQGIALLVRASGSEPMQIAQIQVEPTGNLPKHHRENYPDCKRLGLICLTPGCVMRPITFG